METLSHQHDVRSLERWNALARGVIVSVVAVGFAYLVHHAGPLQTHAFEVVAAAFAATVVLTMLVAGSPPRLTSPGAEPLILTPASPRLREGSSRADLTFCATLHKQALPHGLFTSLGERFMVAYYETYAASPFGVLLVAEMSGVDVGFVAGAWDPAKHKGWLVRHRGPRLAGIGLVSLVARPLTAARFARTRASSYLRAIRRTRSGPATPSRTAADGAAHLSHVATRRGARGLGAGAALVRAFEAHAQAQDAPYTYLTTIADDAGAGTFYETLGWRREETNLGFGEEVFDLWVSRS